LKRKKTLIAAVTTEAGKRGSVKSAVIAPNLDYAGAVLREHGE
jgi:hypothetical protein